VLYKAYGDQPFQRKVLVNELLRALNVLTEGTRAAHIKTMRSMRYIQLLKGGTAYQDSLFRLGAEGVARATRPQPEDEPAETKKGGRPRR